MNAFFASNILLLTMLKIFKSTSWMITLSLILNAAYLNFGFVPCSLSSAAKSSLIKVLWLPVSGRECLFPFTSWTRCWTQKQSGHTLHCFVCCHCYTWSLMLFYDAFWKASCRVVWCFFEQSCWKQLSDDLQDCLQWPLFKELKHRFFSSAKLNTYCIWRICVGCHIKCIYYCQFCVNMFFFSVLIFLQFMPYWKCASLNVSILPWSQFSKSISVDSFIFLEVE